MDYNAPLTFDRLHVGLAVVNQDRTQGGKVTSVDRDGATFEVTWYGRGVVDYSAPDAAYLKPARTALYVNETMAVDGGFVPALVTECEPGYAPLSGSPNGGRPWVWGPTLDLARKTATDANADRGIAPDAAREIVLSSLLAGAR